MKIPFSFIGRVSMSHRLRGVLLMEIVIIFLLYLGLFGGVALVLAKQNQASTFLLSRINLSADVQSLEHLLHARASLQEQYQAGVVQDSRLLTTANKTIDQLVKRVQVRVSEIKVEEGNHLDQEMYSLGRIQSSLHQLESEDAVFLQAKSSPEDLAHRRALQKAIQSHLASWQNLMQEDVIRLNARVLRLQQIAFSALAIQALIVVVCLVIVAYTYVSPAFERLLKKLLRQNQELRALDSLKNEFLSIASHQLRTPLSELKWNLTLLQRKSKRATPDQKALLSQAQASTETMIRLVTSLLNLARIEEGRFEFHPQPTNIELIIRSVLKEVRQDVAKKHLQIKSVITDNPTNVVVDPLLFRQALQNLVHNAIHYNRAGGSVTVTVKQVNRKWCVEVADTGAGIAHEEMGQLFSKFFRGPSATSLHPDGSGLGLYFVKKIMEQHGGKVLVQSRINEGTRFTLVFK